MDAKTIVDALSTIIMFLLSAILTVGLFVAKNWVGGINKRFDKIDERWDRMVERRLEDRRKTETSSDFSVERRENERRADARRKPLVDLDLYR